MQPHNIPTQHGRVEDQSINQSINQSITTSTPSTSTIHTLDHLLLVQLSLGNAADTGRVEVGFFCLNAAQTTELY